MLYATNSGEMPPLSPKFANNIGNLNYWLTLVAELMKRIPQVPTKTPPKHEKLVDMAARCNLEVYCGVYDPVLLEEWAMGMEKIFTVVGVLEEKKVNIRTYYLSC